MKILRLLACYSLFCCALNLLILGYLALRFPPMWILVVGQAIGVYAGAEIVHTMFKKFTVPHPTSLAFNKEVLERYKI